MTYSLSCNRIIVVGLNSAWLLDDKNQFVSNHNAHCDTVGHAYSPLLILVSVHGMSIFTTETT